MIKVLLGLFAFVSLNAFAMPNDSIGVKTINGKQYVMHKVSKGEGVYGISKNTVFHLPMFLRRIQGQTRVLKLTRCC